ncbi:hypothetical protein [Pontibacter actiniarum]|nr:hypothetical protein [Pontibacter actiniarum]
MARQEAKQQVPPEQKGPSLLLSEQGNRPLRLTPQPQEPLVKYSLRRGAVTPVPPEMNSSVEASLGVQPPPPKPLLQAVVPWVLSHI